MSFSPTPAWIQRWFPRRWSEVAGNAAIVQFWMNAIVAGLCNALFTGPTRSCKTRTMNLGIRALVCSNRTEDHSPCGVCAACKASADGRPAENGIFAALCHSQYSIFPIDCENVTAEYLDELRRESSMDSDKTVVVLDEVAALGRRRLEGKLLKLIDESQAIWIASAISLKRKKGSRKGEYTERLSPEMRARFAVKLGTSLPHPDALWPWIIARASEWNITLVDPDVTLPLMVTRSQCRVGFLLHLFAFAAALPERSIGPEDVERFNFDVTD